LVEEGSYGSYNRQVERELRPSLPLGVDLRPGPIRICAALAAAVLAVAALAPGGHGPAPARAEGRPNIVFVLADDFSWNLVRFMPNLRRMQREGATFTNYFVTNSLCCPSRASIFTGRFPHNHGVLSNTAPGGGFAAFRRAGQGHTFATRLERAGYRTSLMGKYLNGYHPKGGYVPPGWSDWQVSGSAYGGFGYVLAVNGRSAPFGGRSRDYMTDVLARRSSRFVRRLSQQRHPFMLEVATYAPHHPFTPAPRHRDAFPGLTAPRGGSFDAPTAGAAGWLRDRPPLTGQQIAGIDGAFRKRAQSVLAVDQLIGRIRSTLRARGLDRNTYIVFSSDNGFHLGEHRLTGGKMTAFDSDIRVPLVVVGPGVQPGTEIDELTANIDLAPTFMRLGGVQPPPSVDGRSLVPLLHGVHPRPWRNALLVEHHRPADPFGDPDHQAALGGRPPSYWALRTTSGTYVEYANGEREYYDLTTDPDQLTNVYDRLPYSELDRLEAKLYALSVCRGAASCWSASTTSP
jgi:arylsulfatase A-like enzyme